MVATAVAEAADGRPIRPVVPADLQGLWAYEPNDCGRPDSDGRLTIDDRTISFLASAYDIKRIVKRSDGSWRVFGLRAKEGEPGRRRGAVTLKLLAPNRLHVADYGADGHAYHRCKAGTR